MKKCCENCVKKETCTQSIGIIFGFCNIDFEPIQTGQPDDDRQNGGIIYGKIQ